MGAAVDIQCKRHDRSQIDLRFSYPVYELSRKDKTSIDLYFFVPYSLGEASKLFDKEDFYREITDYFFFNTPRVEATEAELIASLEMTLRNLSENRSDELRHSAVRQTKFFAHLLKRRLKRVSSWSLDLSDPLGSSSTMEQRCTKLYQVLGQFRSTLIVPYLTPQIDQDKTVRTALLNTDEYLSNRIEGLLTHHLAIIDGYTGVEPLRVCLHRILLEESRYRKAMAREFYLPSSTATDMEHYCYRSSLLKKFINQLLYIKLERSSRGKLYRNLVASFAAALAASWNTLLNMQTYRNAAGKDFGLSMFAVLAFGVGVYVTKDRIKDVSKEYFNQKLKKYLPDYRVHMTYRGSAHDKKVRIGFYDEVLRYLKLDAIPQEVGFLRDFESRRDTSIKMDESVILYSKDIDIDIDAMKNAFPEVKKIEEVLRFNLNNFLKNLSDPWKSLSIFEVDKGPQELQAPRVYHLHMIIKIKQKNTQMSHFRIILDKNGIKRIESVTEKQSLSC